MRITFGGPRCYWTTLASDLRAWEKSRCRRGTGSVAASSSSVTPEKNSVSSKLNHGDICSFREFKIQLLSSALASDKLYRSAGGSPNSHAESTLKSISSFVWQVMCPFVRPVRASAPLDRENGDIRAETLKKVVPSRHLVPDLRSISISSNC